MWSSFCQFHACYMEDTFSFGIQHLTFIYLDCDIVISNETLGMVIKSTWSSWILCNTFPIFWPCSIVPVMEGYLAKSICHLWQTDIHCIWKLTEAYSNTENCSSTSLHFYCETSSEGNFGCNSRCTKEERVTADCACFTCLLEEIKGVCCIFGCKYCHLRSIRVHDSMTHVRVVLCQLQWNCDLMITSFMCCYFTSCISVLLKSHKNRV